MLVAYNDRMRRTSGSAQRRAIAERMLENLRPLLEQLERDEAERAKRNDVARVPVGADEDLEVVWSGGEGLTTMGARRPWMEGR